MLTGLDSKKTDTHRCPLGFGKRKECWNQSADASASTAGVGVLKRQRSLFRLDALRSLRWRRSVGVSKARRRRISSKMPSVSSLVFSRLSARSTGSPFLTITPRMCSVLVGLDGSGRTGAEGLVENRSIVKKQPEKVHRAVSTGPRAVCELMRTRLGGGACGSGRDSIIAKRSVEPRFAYRSKSDPFHRYQ